MIDLGILRRTVLVLAFGIRLAVHHRDLLRRLEAPALDAADTDTPDVGRIIERGNLQLQRPVNVVGMGWRNVLEDGLEHRAHVGTGILQVGHRVTVDG